MAHIFKGKFSKLESEERKKLLPVDKILSQLNIKEKTVIDFGCGIGYFSIPISKLVKKVIAVDLSESMLVELGRRIKTENIELVKSDSIVGLKADLILVVQVLHEVPDAKKFMSECFDSLNENGRLIIIDWAKKESSFGPPSNHRISKDEVLAMTDKKAIEHDIDDSLYFLEF